VDQDRVIHLTVESFAGSIPAVSIPNTWWLAERPEKERRHCRFSR
jgi:hypothetical protein